jgi:uncharacterized RDD family membrane protein YckC
VVLDVASGVRQWAAALIDGAILVTAEAVAVHQSLSLVGLRPSLQALTDAVHGAPASLAPVALAAVGTLLIGHATALWLGGSLGQRVAGLKLVDHAGRPPTTARMAVRAVVGALGTLLFLAGPAYALFIDRYRRGPGDVVAGTVAVRR